MFLGVPQYTMYGLVIDDKMNNAFDSVKLLGIWIDKQINFKIFVQ